MNEKNLFIASPALSGLILLAVSLVDLALFKNGVVSVRTILTWELLLLLACLVVAFSVFIFSIGLLFLRQWSMVIFSMLSVLVMFAFIITAGVNGAAFLNAT
ncbi:MAG: hypothetical protein LBU53_06545 [Zoogloeaceae bacterium]|jgi:hypothetical protein|nr:hypothetical protein [Zoogloeaceae bacterium]